MRLETKEGRRHRLAYRRGGREAEAQKGAVLTACRVVMPSAGEEASPPVDSPSESYAWCSRGRLVWKSLRVVAIVSQSGFAERRIETRTRRGGYQHRDEADP